MGDDNFLSEGKSSSSTSCRRAHGPFFLPSFICTHTHVMGVPQNICSCPSCASSTVTKRTSRRQSLERPSRIEQPRAQRFFPALYLENVWGNPRRVTKTKCRTTEAITATRRSRNKVSSTTVMSAAVLGGVRGGRVPGGA